MRAQGDAGDDGGDGGDGGDVEGAIALPPKVSAIFPRGGPPAKPDYIPAAMPAPAAEAAAATPVLAAPAPVAIVGMQRIPATPATPPPEPPPVLVPAAAAPAPAQVASITPPPAAAVPARNWGIQIGAYSDPDIARQALAALATSQPQMLSGADPQVQKTMTATTPMYRARLMALDQRTAQNICGWLIKNGRNCLTVGP